MVKKPFIDRANARHYRVVHRSQRDPRIADPNAPQHVLAPFVPINIQRAREKQGLAPLEEEYEQEEDFEDFDDEDFEGEDKEEEKVPQLEPIEKSPGEAALFGIYYDDRDYDYTQHLRPVGQVPDAVILDAPIKKKTVQFDLPEEALPSKEEQIVGLLNQAAYPEGLQPDMDPALREVLECLDDDAYVDDNLDDAYFHKLDEQGNGSESDEQETEQSNSAYFQEMKQFKVKKNSEDEDSDAYSDDYSDESFHSKRQQKSNFSMSSSVLHRTKELQLLDARFDQLYLNYSDNELGALDEEEENIREQGQSVAQPQIEAMFDEFLEREEILGSKLNTRLVPGDDAMAKMQALRSSLLETNRNSHGQSKWMKIMQRYLNKESLNELEQDSSSSESESDAEWIPTEPKKKLEWDAQSILTTLSNLENHPTKLTSSKPRIRINRQGFPTVQPKQELEKDNDTSSDESVPVAINLGVSRNKQESNEEKRLRKAAVKSQRRQRRQEKKELKQAFSRETQRQKAIVSSTHTPL